jgi:hypothetical protein
MAIDKGIEVSELTFASANPNVAATSDIWLPDPLTGQEVPLTPFQQNNLFGDTTIADDLLLPTINKVLVQDQNLNVNGLEVDVPEVPFYPKIIPFHFASEEYLNNIEGVTKTFLTINLQIPLNIIPAVTNIQLIGWTGHINNILSQGQTFGPTAVFNGIVTGDQFLRNRAYMFKVNRTFRWAFADNTTQPGGTAVVPSGQLGPFIKATQTQIEFYASTGINAPISWYDIPAYAKSPLSRNFSFDGQALGGVAMDSSFCTDDNIYADSTSPPEYYITNFPMTFTAKFPQYGNLGEFNNRTKCVIKGLAYLY